MSDSDTVHQPAPSSPSRESAGGDHPSQPPPRGVILPWWGRGLRRMLVPSFALACRAGFEINVRGIEHFRNRPATIVAANHKSDFDTIILIPAFFRAHRGRGPVRGSVFVAAEQMFEPGYVSMYLLRQHWRIIRRLLYPANMSALLQAIGAHPIPGSRRRKFGRHLRTIQDHAGNLPLEQVLKQSPASWFHGANDTMRISRVLRWRYRKPLDRSCSWSRFQPEIARILRAAHMEEVEASLAYFAGVLNAGGCMYFATEGAISTDGSFDGVKAGVSRLVHAADRPVTLQPIHFTYDPMTTGRGTVFLTVGPEITGSEKWSRSEIEQTTAQAIGRLATITLPQLAAEALEKKLAAGPCDVNEEDFKRGLWTRACELADQGCAVDPRLLSEEAFARRWSRFMAYCQKQHLARRQARMIVFHPVPPANAAQTRWWRYAANELRQALDAAAPAHHP